MSDEVLDGVVRAGPAPTDAVRPQVVIRDEHGTVVQNLLWREVLRDYRLAERFASGVTDPRNMIIITGT